MSFECRARKKLKFQLAHQPSKLVLDDRTAVFSDPDNVQLFEEETLMEYEVTNFNGII